MPLGAYITDRRRISPVLPGLCQGRRCLRLHRRKGKVKELISLRRIVVLCAEASVQQRLCAQSSYQGIPFRTAFGTIDGVGGGMKKLEAEHYHPERQRRIWSITPALGPAFPSRFFASLRMTGHCAQNDSYQSRKFTGSGRGRQ